MDPMLRKLFRVRKYEHIFVLFACAGPVSEPIFGSDDPALVCQVVYELQGRTFGHG